MFKTNNNEMDNEEKLNKVHEILEKEKQMNKKEAWNKLDKTVKLIKLNEFADHFVLSDEASSICLNNPIARNSNMLKQFLSDCLNKGKFQKAKDVVYNKESGKITSIPALSFNNVNKAYTLRIVDPKRVSTLKSLAPKHIIIKNISNVSDYISEDTENGDADSVADSDSITQIGAEL